MKSYSFKSGCRTPRPRRYRNRRIGDFLKELDLTEGKSTGITTVRSKLKSNGSPSAIYEFDDERTGFCATIKIHSEFVKDNEGQNVPQNVPQNNSRLDIILRQIKETPEISQEAIANNLGVTRRTINRDLDRLRKCYKIEWVGSAKSGHWEVKKL